MKADIYFKGDAAKYTGESEVIYGGLFYEVIMLEGADKGKTKMIVRPEDKTYGSYTWEKIYRNLDGNDLPK